MSRRSLCVVVAFLVLGAAFVWLVFRARHPQSAALAVPQSLAADAVMLASAPGKWQSEAVKATLRDGTARDLTLGIEFGPPSRVGQSNAPDAQAKLFTSTPPTNLTPGAIASSSMGDGSFQDVRLREKDGVRTITITRALPENDPNPARTQRRFDRYWSVSFRYELKDNVLTLKGFPTTNKVDWGVSAFTVPKEEIKFKVVP